MPRGIARFERSSTFWRLKMSLGTILLIVLVLILLGVIPTWPHSRQWGFAPAGTVGLVLLVLLILFLTGRI
jgi:hypothetical protein